MIVLRLAAVRLPTFSSGQKAVPRRRWRSAESGARGSRRRRTCSGSWSRSKATQASYSGAARWSARASGSQAPQAAATTTRARFAMSRASDGAARPPGGRALRVRGRDLPLAVHTTGGMRVRAARGGSPRAAARSRPRRRESWRARAPPARAQALRTDHRPPGRWAPGRVCLACFSIDRGARRSPRLRPHEAVHSCTHSCK